MVWIKLFILREKTTQNPASASPDFYAAIFCLILCFHYWASCSSLQTPTCLSLHHFLGLPWLYSLLHSPYKFQHHVFLERCFLTPRLCYLSLHYKNRVISLWWITDVGVFLHFKILKNRCYIHLSWCPSAWYIHSFSKCLLSSYCVPLLFVALGIA